MTVKKLSIKKNKATGKLKIHKNKPADEEQEELDLEEQEEEALEEPLYVKGKLHPDKSKKAQQAPIGSNYEQHTDDGDVLWVKVAVGEWELMDVPDEEEEEPEEEEESEVQEFVDEETGEIFFEGQVVNGFVAVVKGKELIWEEQVEVAEIKHGKQPMANIGYGLDRTINLGNYESLKIHVTIHVPSLVNEEEIEQNYEFCKGWTEMKMAEVTKKYTDEAADDIPF